MCECETAIIQKQLCSIWSWSQFVNRDNIGAALSNPGERGKSSAASSYPGDWGEKGLNTAAADPGESVVCVCMCVIGCGVCKAVYKRDKHCREELSSLFVC